MALLKMIVSLLTFVVIAYAQEEKKIICSLTQSPVAEGLPVAIICKFPAEALVDRKKISVLREVNHKSTPDTIIKCEWNDGNSAYKCQVNEDGYYINETEVGEKMTIFIPSVAKHQEGNYSCQTASFVPTACVLEVTESPLVSGCGDISSTDGQKTVLSFHFNKNISESTIIILRQPLDYTQNERRVMMCTGGTFGKSVCEIDAGYQLLNQISSTRIDLQIAAVRHDNEGRYIAKVSGRHPGSWTPCYLRLKETSTVGKITTESKSTDTSDNATGGSSDSNNGQTTAILVLLIILIVTVAGVSVLYILKQIGIHSRIPRKSKRTATPRDDEDPAESLPLAEPRETKITAEVHTQTEAAGLCDSGTDCPTDLPLKPEPVHLELPDKAEVRDSFA